MGFPAQAGLGSVPSPALGAGREAEASLLVQRVARAGGRAGLGGRPGLVWLWVQNQPEPPHVPRGSAPGRAGMYSVNKSLQLFRLFWIDEALFLLILFFLCM